MGEKSDKKMCEKGQAQIEKRRRQNRESQRRYRERHRSRSTRDTLLDVAQNTLPFERAHYWPTTAGIALSQPSTASAPPPLVPPPLSFPLSHFATTAGPPMITSTSTTTRNPPTAGVSSTLDASYLDPRLMAPSTTSPAAISSLLTSTNPSDLNWPTSASSASPISDFLLCPTTMAVCGSATTASSYDYDFAPFTGVQHPPSPPASSSLPSPALSSTTTTTAAGPSPGAGAPTPSPSPGYCHNPHHLQQHLCLPHHQQQQTSPPYLDLGLGMGMASLVNNVAVHMGRSSSWAGSRGQTPEEPSSIPFSNGNGSGSGSGRGMGGDAPPGGLSGRATRRKRSTTSTGSAPAPGSPLSWAGKSLSGTGSGAGGWEFEGMLPAYLAGGGAILTSDEIVAGLAVQP